VLAAEQRVAREADHAIDPVEQPGSIDRVMADGADRLLAGRAKVPGDEAAGSDHEQSAGAGTARRHARP
jgi:hypothetical protein